MHVHSSVTELLQTKNIPFDITSIEGFESILCDSTDATRRNHVKALLMRAGGNEAQVLIPSDHMVDPRALNVEFGHVFESHSSVYLQQLLNSQKLDNVPAIPNWRNMSCFIDASLMRCENLFLDSGNSAQLLKVSIDSFMDMTKEARISEFAIPIPKHKPDPTKDEDDILFSVSRFTKRRIRQRLEETLELPPIPETAMRIIKLRADPNADINDLTNIIEIDPSIAAQVVSWAASPYYSAPGKIKSVHDAIVRVLGFDMVLNLALGLALGRTLSMAALSKRLLDNFWRNAVYTAAVVEGLVTSIERSNRPNFGLAYLSGLLSNFGYLIMAEVFPPYFSNVEFWNSVNVHAPRTSIEQHLLGCDSNQIAACLMHNWNIPNEVVTALRQQNNPGYDGKHAIHAKLLYVAKQLLARHGFGDSLAEAIPESYYEEIYLSQESANLTVTNILKAGDELDDIATKLRV